MSPATNAPARDTYRFGTNLVLFEIAALVALIAYMPSPSLLIGGLIVIWGTACGVGRLFEDIKPET